MAEPADATQPEDDTRAQALADEIGDASLSAETVARISATVEHSGRLRDRFTPDRFGGDLLLCTAGPKALADESTPYVGGRITTHEIATTHFRIMRPSALTQIGPVLAAALAGANR
ncbi:hypothetical protein ACGFIW_17200 [Micromonospora sp. NPDC048935]|uniref:hypothetical protein n=1 Tax=Micromonospora sp. NPDC048935 TaxID=3364262 RepID=UPI0037153469